MAAEKWNYDLTRAAHDHAAEIARQNADDGE
jgi:hypothetical protein